MKREVFETGKTYRSDCGKLVKTIKKRTEKTVLFTDGTRKKIHFLGDIEFISFIGEIESKYFNPENEMLKERKSVEKLIRDYTSYKTAEQLILNNATIRPDSFPKAQTVRDFVNNYFNVVLPK